jgi:sugar-specific transcriptional regulator TrmB
MKEKLKSIGLTSIEADIYLTLLQLGKCNVGKIAKETKINRTYIYDILSKLIDKGFVSYAIHNNIKYYASADPQKILSYMQEKQTKLLQDIRTANEIIPNLMKLAVKKNDDSVEIYEGKEGLKTILDDIVNSKQGIMTYGSEGNFTNVLQYYFKHYLKRLEDNSISMRVIFSEDNKKKILKWKFAKVRYIPKEYKTPTETTIYGNNVVIFLLSRKPKAILIRGEIASRSYKKYFEFMWRNAI